MFRRGAGRVERNGCALIRDERRTDRQAPDCARCALYHRCENAAENSFCTRFRTKAEEDRGEGPAEAWLRGEEI